MTVYGEKYEATRKMDTTGVAKLFRADVKAAIKSGTIPAGVKLSVRTEYFSGGSSIDVKIRALPCRLFSGERGPTGMAKYNPGAEAIRDRLRSMLDAYNFDGSDHMTDYFHVRFYGEVVFDWEFARDREGCGGAPWVTGT